MIMDANSFVKSLKEISPKIEELNSLSLSDEYTEKFLASFECDKKSNEESYTDPIIALVNNFHVTNIEIGLVTFLEELKEDKTYIYIGKLELDFIAICKITNEIVVLDHISMNILWYCAENSSLFLDALIECASFFKTRFFDDSLWESSDSILKYSINISNVAGGEKYGSFYKMLLGYF